MCNFARMKRIFHVVSHFELGGAERVAINIARSATPDYEYHIVEVIRGRSAFTDSLLQELHAAGIVFHRSPIPVLISFHYVFERLAALLFPLWFVFIYRKYRPDVIHCHTDIPDLAVYCFRLWFSRLTSKTVILRTIHNTRLWVGMERKGRKIEQMFQHSGANIAISEATADAYQQQYAQRPPIIFNGTELPPSQPYAGIKPGMLNIVFAGRFVEQKGISVLVDIIKSLADDNRYFFHIFGSGPLQPLLDGMSDLPNVAVHPPLFGLSACLSSFDYVLMPSLHEGLATLSIEASLSHTPTIINACPGLRDTLPDDWPLKVGGNDMAMYHHLFNEVIPNGHREHWGNVAYEFSKQRFSIRQMQEQYERLYASRTNACNKETTSGVA